MELHWTVCEGPKICRGCNVRHPRAVYRLFNNPYAFTNV